MNEEMDNIVVLLDENGEEVKFEFLDAVEFKNNEYVLMRDLTEAEDDLNTDDEDVVEVVIFKLEKDENGEETLISVIDEEELESVFSVFKQKN